MSDRTKVTRSSGNVFAHLGLKDPEERLAKAELAVRIAAAIKARKLTQVAAAEVCAIDQPKISKLMRGDLYGFSTDQLLRLLTHSARTWRSSCGIGRVGDAGSRAS